MSPAQYALFFIQRQADAAENKSQACSVYNAAEKGSSPVLLQFPLCRAGTRLPNKLKKA